MPLRPTKVRYAALSWLIFAAALAYLSRNAVGVAESTIRAEFDLTKSQTGWFMGTFFWSYALLQIPAGLFGQRVGTRVSLSIFALLWAGAAMMLGFSPVFWMLIAAQFVMGLAQAGAFPAATHSISKWMPLNQRSLSCGLLASGMQVGGIAAALLTGTLMAGGWGWSEFVVPWIEWTCPEFTASPMVWRWVFVLFAVPSIIWAAGFYVRFRDDPQADSRVNFGELERIRAGVKPEPSGVLPGPTPWGRALRSSTLWLLCLQQFCRASGAIFFATWFPTFLQETRGVEIAKSGYLQALMFGAIFIGSIGGGALLDLVWKRTKSLRASRSGVGAVCLGLTSALILGAFLVESLPMAIGLLGASAFLAALAGPSAYSAAIDISGRYTPPFFRDDEHGGQHRRRSDAHCARDALRLARQLEPSADSVRRDLSDRRALLAVHQSGQKDCLDGLYLGQN